MPPKTDSRRHRSHKGTERRRKLLSCVRCHEMKKKCNRKYPCNTCVKLDRIEACVYRDFTRPGILEGENLFQLSTEENGRIPPTSVTCNKIVPSGTAILDMPRMTVEVVKQHSRRKSPPNCRTTMMEKNREAMHFPISSISALHDGNRSSAVPLNISDCTALGTQLRFSACQSLVYNSPKWAPIFDSNVQKQMHELMQSNGGTILDMCTYYFQTVHPWLPVIFQRRVLQRLTSHQALQADFTLLLLSMHLLTQVPEGGARWSSSQESLYIKTKRFYNEVQLLQPPSTEIVQAGLLLTFYENAHGHHKTAYISIGTCVQIARVLGLHNKLSMAQPKGAEASMKIEEEKTVWWGCIVLERLIGREEMQPSRPLLIEQPKSTDELPSDPDKRGKIEGCLFTLTPRYLDETGLGVSVGAFGREAQGATLLGGVLWHVAQSHSDPNIREADTRRLDKSLQSFLSMILEEAKQDHVAYCGVNSMTVGSLFTLHQAQLAYNRQLGKLDTCESSQYSILSLNAATRIMLAVAQTSNSVFATGDPGLVPPCAIFPCLQAVLWLLESSTEQLAEVEDVREYLWHISQRWFAAEESLKDIDAATDLPLRRFDKCLHPVRKNLDLHKIRHCIC